MQPTITAEHEQFLSQKEFCKAVGITEAWARELRRIGVLPFIGNKPVYIPLRAGTEAIISFAQRVQAATQVGSQDGLEAL